MGGSTFERQFVRALTECGRPALRAPSSGAATDRELPDVLSGTRVEMNGISGPIGTFSKAWAVEVKTTSGTTAYADESEVEKLGRFAHAFGAEAFVAAKFKRSGGGRSGFYVVRPDDCRPTDGGQFGVPESDARERASWLVYPATDEKDALVQEVADA